MATALRTTPILKTNSSCCCLQPIRYLNLRPQSVQLTRYGLFPSWQISQKDIKPDIVCNSQSTVKPYPAKYTKRAFVSVRDTTNLGFLARRLRSLGYTIVSTPKTAAELHKLGVITTEVCPFESLLRFPDKRDERRLDDFDILVVNSHRGGRELTDWLWVAKVNKDALVVVDPRDYFSVLAHLEEEEDLEDNKFRRILDLKLSQYTDDIVSDRLTEAKRSFRGYDRCIATAIQHHGNEMSSKSYLDANVAWNWVSNFVDPTCVVMNFMYPCGAASRNDILEAHKLAVEDTQFGGPFGGVVTFNVEVDEALARQILEFVHPLEDKADYEVVVAPSYSEKALEILRETSKELTVLEAKKKEKKADELFVDDVRFTSVTERCPTKMELDDIRFAWLCVIHGGMNLVVAKNKCMLGSGTWGEKLPIEDGLRKAITDSGKEAKGAVLASDVFFPSDRMDILKKAYEKGVSVIVGRSGGAIGDKKAIELCNKYGVSLVFVEESSQQ